MQYTETERKKVHLYRMAGAERECKRCLASIGVKAGLPAIADHA